MHKNHPLPPNKTGSIPKSAHVKRLDIATSVFFGMGFFFLRLQLLPILFLPAIAYLLASASHFIGFLLSIISHKLSPKHHKHDDALYDLIHHNYLFMLSSTIGLFAVATGVVGIFFPIGAVLAGWLYFVSQVVWLVAEYCKYKARPIHEEKYSTTRQLASLRLSAFLSVTSLVMAIATTLMFVYPPLILPILLTATIISLAVNLGALEAWLSYRFDRHVPDIIELIPDDEQLLQTMPESFNTKPRPRSVTYPPALEGERKSQYAVHFFNNQKVTPNNDQPHAQQGFHCGN